MRMALSHCFASPVTALNQLTTPVRTSTASNRGSTTSNSIALIHRAYVSKMPSRQIVATNLPTITLPNLTIILTGLTAQQACFVTGLSAQLLTIPSPGCRTSLRTLCSALVNEKLAKKAHGLLASTIGDYSPKK